MPRTAHLLGRAGGNDRTAAVSALRAEVDQPVGRFDDIEIVLDHEHGVAAVDKLLQHVRSFCTSYICRPVVGSSRI